MKRDTKEHNKQKQQKYNLLELIFLYLLTFCLSVPFSDVDEFNALWLRLVPIFPILSGKNV